MTTLNKWHDVTNDGDAYPTYTRDTWSIPEGGVEMWCAAWDSTKVIKPMSDGMHVTVNGSVYHCDELMGKLEQGRYAWGIVGMEMTREQQINGRWTPVKAA